MYSYFAQVLEEHGPLKTDHPLLVGELENFPPDALQKIEESGGLKPFLQQSIRFVMKDDVIALMKHAGVLQNVTREQSSHDLTCCTFDDDNETTLNPFAEEFYPTVSRMGNIASSEDLYNGAFGDTSCEQFTRPSQECQHAHHLQDSYFEISKSSHSPFESTSENFVPQKQIFNSAINISSIKQTGQTESDDFFNERDNGANSFQHGMAACNEQVLGGSNSIECFLIMTVIAKSLL